MTGQEALTYHLALVRGDRTLSDHERESIQKRMEEICKAKQPFQRIVVSREEALEMFQENKFKVELISNLPLVGCCRFNPA